MWVCFACTFDITHPIWDQGELAYPSIWDQSCRKASVTAAQRSHRPQEKTEHWWSDVRKTCPPLWDHVYWQSFWTLLVSYPRLTDPSISETLYCLSHSELLVGVGLWWRCYSQGTSSTSSLPTVPNLWRLLLTITMVLSNLKSAKQLLLTYRNVFTARVAVNTSRQYIWISPSS